MTPEATRKMALDRLAVLSAQEFEILYRVAKGERMCDMDGAAGYSGSAMRTRLLRLRDKLGCATTE